MIAAFLRKLQDLWFAASRQDRPQFYAAAGGVVLWKVTAREVRGVFMPLPVEDRGGGVGEMRGDGVAERGAVIGL
ncbi:hypothetical protein, partial [Rhodovulum sp. BSW8]|uniref:hypothetical protein n=1 Tax=Rhodovulum sp. BSW8 TaxID=2259645 RepID=UPI001A9FBB12